MQRLFAAVLFSLATLGCTTPALSQTVKVVDKMLKVAFYEAGYLYSNNQGIDKDVVDEIKIRGGYSFQYVEMPRARIWITLANGTLPMSVSGIQNPERDKFAYFIPYIVQNNKAIVMNAKYTTPASIINTKNTRIAVVRSFKHGEYFDEFLEKFRANGGVITEVPTIQNLFLMLKAENRVDMIISQPAFYAKELKDLGIRSKVIIRDWDTPVKKPIVLSLILNKAHFSEQEVTKMRKIVQAMRKDGTMKKIFSKYLSNKEVKEAMNF